MKQIKEAIKKAAKGLWESFPILLGVILLVSFTNKLVPKTMYTFFFQGNYIIDPIVGATIGSILAGNPITSYVLAGELFLQGVNLIAITAFIVSWVTVGLVQLPAESMLLGKRFSITRNITAFVFSIIVAILTTIGVNLL